MYNLTILSGYYFVQPKPQPEITMNRFINERKDNWQRLKDLLSISEVSSLRGLSRLEVREFGELYRRAVSNLAIARAETRDPKFINYLNSLVIRAHGKIYRAEENGVNLIWNFFAKDFPQALWTLQAKLGTIIFVNFSRSNLKFKRRRKGYDRTKDGKNYVRTSSRCRIKV